MTKLKFYLQFFLILLIFILPSLTAPFFERGEHILNFGTFSPWILACLAVSIFLFLQERHSQTKTNRGGGFKIKDLLTQAEFFKTLGFLCVIAAVFEFLGVLLKMRSQPQIVFPKTPLEIVFCVITLVAAAFYEEVLYRGYLPFAVSSRSDALVAEGEQDNNFHLCNRSEATEQGQVLEAVSSGSKQRQIAAEAVAVLVFAFGHLQNGWLAVLNAFFAGIVLRRCAIKTQGIWAGFAAHLIYNVMNLIVLVKIV